MCIFCRFQPHVLPLLGWTWWSGLLANQRWNVLPCSCWKRFFGVAGVFFVMTSSFLEDPRPEDATICDWALKVWFCWDHRWLVVEPRKIIAPFLPRWPFHGIEVECLHLASVIHRDIKLSNLLLNNKARENRGKIPGGTSPAQLNKSQSCGVCYRQLQGNTCWLRGNPTCNWRMPHVPPPIVTIVSTAESGLQWQLSFE